MSTLLTTADVLHSKLDGDWKDQQTRAVLADWHEDRGDWAAVECLRWLVARDRYPRYCRYPNARVGVVSGSGGDGIVEYFCWCSERTFYYYNVRHGEETVYPDGHSTRRSALPDAVFDLLAWPPERKYSWRPYLLLTNKGSRSYWWEIDGMCRRGAEEAAVAAWRAARQRGWAPDE